MNERFSFSNFLEDLGMRMAAGAVVVGIFFGLGWINQNDFLGLSTILGNQLGFFITGFSLVTLAALAWIVFQHYRT